MRASSRAGMELARLLFASISVAHRFPYPDARGCFPDRSLGRRYPHEPDVEPVEGISLPGRHT